MVTIFDVAVALPDFCINIFSDINYLKILYSKVVQCAKIGLEVSKNHFVNFKIMHRRF